MLDRDLVTRRRFLNRVSLALSGLAAAVVSVLIVAYLLSRLAEKMLPMRKGGGPSMTTPTTRRASRARLVLNGEASAGRAADFVQQWTRRAGRPLFTAGLAARGGERRACSGLLEDGARPGREPHGTDTAAGGAVLHRRSCLREPPSRWFNGEL
jgi:hypothetical protein